MKIKILFTFLLYLFAQGVMSAQSEEYIEIVTDNYGWAADQTLSSTDKKYLISGTVNIQNLKMRDGAELVINGDLYVTNSLTFDGDATISGSGNLTSKYIYNDKDFNLDITTGNLSIRWWEAEGGNITCTNLDIIKKFNGQTSVTAENLLVHSNITIENIENITFKNLQNYGIVQSDTLVILAGGIVNNSGSISCLSTLELNDGVHMRSTGTVTVEHNIYISGDVYVNTSDHFKSSIGGKPTVNVNLEFKRGKFSYFTPPFEIEASALGTIETENTPEDDETSESVWLYQYNEAAESSTPNENSWQEMASGTLAPGKGYSIWVSNVGTSDTSKIISLSSDDIFYPYLEDVIKDNISFTSGSLTSGFNALGNVFSLPLLPPPSDYVNAYYYFNGTQYLTMAGSGSIYTPDIAVSELQIPSYACFFAHVNAKPSLLFSIEDLSENSLVTRIKSSTLNTPEYIRIAVQNETAYDDAVLQFVQDGTFEYDNTDITKMFASTSDAGIQISSSLTDNSGNYAIQSLPAIDDLAYGEALDIPLKFLVSQSGTYSISAKLTNISSNQVTPYLYDNATGVMTELSEELSPITISSSYDRNERYSVKVFTSTATNIDQEVSSEATVYVANKTLHVQTSNNNTGIVKLLDVSGKLVQVDNFDGTSSISLSTLPQGMYIVHISSENDSSMVEKILVQ